MVELKHFEEQLKNVIQETAEVSVEINKYRAMIRTKVQDMKKMRDFKDGPLATAAKNIEGYVDRNYAHTREYLEQLKRQNTMADNMLDGLLADKIDPDVTSEGSVNVDPLE